MAFLALRAYQDADTLDRYASAPLPTFEVSSTTGLSLTVCRYEVPFFGQFATRFLDDE